MPSKRYREGGQVVLDNVQVGEAIVNSFKENEGSTISILGHSFGGAGDWDDE